MGKACAAGGLAEHPGRTPSLTRKKGVRAPFTCGAGNADASSLLLLGGRCVRAIAVITQAYEPSLHQISPLAGTN